MEKTIKSANFGDISKSLVKKQNKIIQKVEDDFDPSKIDILDEYKEILDFVKRKGQAMFLTGKAGTGKSTAIKYIKYMISKSAVIAPTTIAAENVKGSTIYSFFGFPPSFIDPESIQLPISRIPIIQNLDLLIIDEVSMVSSSLVDAINIALQKGKNNKKIFGGIPILFVGDLFQLPPIIEDEEIKKYYGGDDGKYDSEFFYSAEVFNELNDTQICELQIVKRQEESSPNNKKFIEALNSIRTNTKDIYAYIDFLNIECFENRSTDSFDHAITLVPTKSKAKGINKDKFNSIQGNSKSYQGHLLNLTAEDIKRFQAPDELILKVGVQVVFVNNNKPNWTNGDLGTITKMEDNLIEVLIHKTGLVKNVNRAEFPKYKYLYNTDNKRIELTIIGKFIQFPINLGWAITIHKSQGMTLEKAIVDIDGCAFAEGQTYVALSRVKSIESLKLNSKITYGDIKVNQTILDFYNLILPEYYNLNKEE
jgi:ATP-dependent DNA helicase PIF1